MPYILLDNGATLADTNIIIRTLARERGIDLDYLRTPEELASEHVTMRLVEESLYYAMVWERWMLPAFWPISRDGYFGTLPGPLRTLFANLIRRKIKTTLRGQGLLCHEPDEIIARGIADVRGLSALLGQKAFFGGERPGVADASAYGVLANLLGFPGRTALKTAVQACPNLVTFCRRIEYLYWLNLAASGSAVAIRPAIKNVA